MPGPAPLFRQSAIDTRLRPQADVLAADTALVVVDAQYQFCSMADNEKAVKRALSRIRQARDVADAHNLPSFYVFLTTRSWDKRPFVPPVGAESLYRQRLSGAFEIVHKDHSSAFSHADPKDYKKDTPFRLRLRDYPQVKRLVFAGFNTSACVIASAREAKLHGFESVVLADACANVCDFVQGSNADELHDSSLRSMAGHLGITVTTVRAFAHHLESGGLAPIKPFITASVADVPLGYCWG